MVEIMAIPVYEGDAIPPTEREREAARLALGSGDGPQVDGSFPVLVAPGATPPALSVDGAPAADGSLLGEGAPAAAPVVRDRSALSPARQVRQLAFRGVRRALPRLADMAAGAIGERPVRDEVAIAATKVLAQLALMDAVPRAELRAAMKRQVAAILRWCDHHGVSADARDDLLREVAGAWL